MFIEFFKILDMKQLYFLLLFISFTTFSQNVTITKVIESGCASPFVKTVELYVDGTVNFATDVTMNYMQNGAPWADNQIDVSGLGTITDSFVYLVRDIALMEAEFPNTTFDSSNTIVVSSSTNGDDGYQIVLNGNVVSQFGRTETDADNDTETDWNHNDAVATRKDGVPDLGTWDRSHWDFTAENALDDFTNCQDTADPKTKNLESHFATLGSTFSLGSGSGWTPSAATCTTSLTDTNASCESAMAGATGDTYTAYIDFSGGDVGTTFTITASAGTVGGDNPSSAATGTIEITAIPEGTDITVTVSDTSDGGVCDLSTTIESPECIPLIVNEVLFDPASDDSETTEVEGDANGDGTRDFAQDEFIEFYNMGDTSLDISGYMLYDANGFANNTPRHIFPASTIIPSKGILVLFGGGTPTGSFGGAIVQTASEDPDPNDAEVNPELNLSNNGDVITITNTSGDIALIYSSTSTGVDHGENQSVTRSPDFTGAFTLHTEANASLAFSPGLKVDGTTLSSDLFEVNDFKMYPNPVSKSQNFVILSLDKTNVEVSVFNLLGKKMNSEFVNNHLTIDNLSSGVYLVRISKENTSITKKLLIK